MDKTKINAGTKVVTISENFVNYLKIKFINEVLEAKNQKSANALVAYATFLNKEGINRENYPLYLKIIESNNKYAIDMILEGYEPESYLDFIVPNPYIVKTIFSIFNSLKSNEMYVKSLRIFCGILIKVYTSAEEGYILYPPTIPDVNNLAKFLDESKDQDFELNRDILDILMSLTELDNIGETDLDKKNIARQAGRIRSDFFDSKRSLLQSLTGVILEKVENPSYGIPPEYIYVS